MASARHTAQRASHSTFELPELRLTQAAGRHAVLARAVLGALGMLAGAPAMAQSWCTDEGPSVVVANDRTTSCYLNGSSSLTVEEGGSIQQNGNNAVISNGTPFILNHGRISGLGSYVGVVSQGGVLGLLTNSATGLIEGGTGISVGNGSTITTLENQGKITGRMFGGVANAGAIGTFNNSGSIDIGGVYGGAAISLTGTGSIGTLTNTDSGKITQNAAGAYAIRNIGTIGNIDNSGEISSAGGAIYNNGIIGEIVNSGVIRAASGEDAIWNEGVITTGIRNTGTIDGGVGLGHATLYLEGDDASVTGQVNGTAGSGVVVLGAFTSENNFSVDRFEVAQGGTLRFGGDHFVKTREGVFQNNGIVSIPAGTVAEISGDFVQSNHGWVVIEAASASSYGKLNILGNASFQGDAQLRIGVAESATLANRDVLTDVVTANSLDLDGGIVIEDNSELFNFVPTIQNNSLELLTVLDGGTNPDDGQGGDDGGNGNDNGAGKPPVSSGGAVSNRVSAQGFGQGMGAAQVLDGIVANTGNTGDVATIVTAFGRLGSQEEVVGAVAQTLPLMSANLNQVSIGSMQGVNRVIQGRLDGMGGFSGMSSGEGYLADKHLWFKPLASYADQDDRDGIAGYRASTYGFVFGGDTLVGQASRVGLAFSYARSDVDGKSTARSNRADIDAYQLIAYGSHTVAALPNVEVNWQADIGMNQNDGRRSINFGGLNRTAESDFDSTTAHLGAGISRGFQVGEKTRFTPSIRTDYYRIRNESYTESGAEGLNLRVSSQTSEQWFAMLEGRLQHQLNDRAAVVVNLGAGYEMLGESNGITSSYVGGGAAFRTPGMEPGRWLGRAGLGLSMHANERTEITARYDLEGRSGFTAQTASVNVRWAF